MSLTELRSYAHEVETDGLSLLGRLLWYTIRDTKVDHKTVLQLLHDNGLSSLLVPPYPEDVDTFRRVSTKASRKKIEVPGQPGIFENYLMREVSGRGGDSILRRIVCEQVDAKGRKLGYVQCLDIEFDRKTLRITTSPLEECTDFNQRHVAGEIGGEVKREFHSWRGKLGSYAIREFVRRIILDLGGTCVRTSGGVYFVREEHAQKLSGLRNFVAGIPGGSIMDIVPLVDDRDQRDMLKRAFQAESVGAIDNAMIEIKHLKRDARNGKPITDAQANKYLRIFGELTHKTKDYRGLLEDELQEIQSRIPLFQRQVLELRAAASKPTP